MKVVTRLAVLVVAGALALAGCTDAEPGPSASPSAPPSPSATAASLDSRPLDEQLFEAVRAGDLAVAALALEAGQTPDFWVGDSSPLSVAVGRDDLVMTQLLIDGGATAANDEGDHIYAAAERAGPEVIVLLLESGSSAVGPEGEEGSVLASAAFAGNVRAIEALIAAGAPVDGPFLDPLGDVYTPIFAAAYGGNVEAVQALVEHGADPYSPAARGYTPSEWAASQGHDAVVEYLASIGA